MTYTIRKKCENTKKACIGEMIFSGRVYINIFTYYEHQCNKCGYTDSYQIKYPIVINQKI